MSQCYNFEKLRRFMSKWEKHETKKSIVTREEERVHAEIGLSFFQLHFRNTVKTGFLFKFVIVIDQYKRE